MMSGDEIVPRPSIFLNEPQDIIWQIEDALRKNAGNGVNLSAADFFLLPQILNSSLMSNTNHILESSNIKSRPELIGIYIAYSIVFLVSLVANSLVCYVIIKNKRFRSVTYAFIAN